MPKARFSSLLLSSAAMALAVTGCSSGGSDLPPAASAPIPQSAGEEYVIGALDQLTVHVWRNPELGAQNIQVRPDGRITTPLVTDMPAAGKTSAMLAQDIRLALSQYIEEPLVSVIVTRFAGAPSQQVRIIGATEKPASVPYRANMSVLDAMIMVGGLSQYASGNRAKLIRYDKQQGRQRQYKLRLGDLLNKGDTRQNVMLQPGDVIIIPESMF